MIVTNKDVAACWVHNGISELRQALVVVCLEPLEFSHSLNEEDASFDEDWCLS